jgi:hypothetical protein
MLAGAGRHLETQFIAVCGAKSTGSRVPNNSTFSQNLWPVSSAAPKASPGQAAFDAIVQKDPPKQWPRELGYIYPFGTQKLALTTKIIGESAGDGGGVIRAALANRISNTAPAATENVSVMRVPKFKFAKVILTMKESEGSAGIPRKSRITDLPYTAYKKDSVSCPFGKKDASDTYEAAADDIRSNANLKTALGKKDTTFYIVPQQSAT